MCRTGKGFVDREIVGINSLKPDQVFTRTEPHLTRLIGNQAIDSTVHAELRRRISAKIEGSEGYEGEEMKQALLKELRKYPVVLWMAGAMFLWQVAHQVLPSVWSFYTILKFGWSTAEVGYSLAAAGIVMVTAQGVLSRRLIPRLGGDRNAALGAPCNSLSRG